MRQKLHFYLLVCLFQCLTFNAQEKDSLMGLIRQSDSFDRIRFAGMFYDYSVDDNASPETFDAFLAECYQVAKAKNDTEFKDYLDFYKRMRRVLFISYDDPEKRKAKILKMWEISLAYYQALGDERFIAICNLYLGHFYFIMGENAKSIEKSLFADEGFKKIGYGKFPDMGKYFHNMSLVFYFFKQYQKVAEMMEISEHLRPYNENIHIQQYNTLGAAYTQLKEYDKAASAFVKTREMAIKYNNSFWIAFGSQGLAKIFIEKGKYADALFLYERDLELMEKHKESEKREYSQYLLGMAKCNILLNKIDLAAKYLHSINYNLTSNKKEQLFMFGVTYQDVNYWLDFYEVQQKYQYALKNYRDAYHYSDSLYAVKYRIVNTFNNLQVEVVQNRIEVQNNQYQNDTNRATIKSKNQQMTFIISLLAIVAIATTLVVRKNLKIRSQNKIINTQLGELSKTLEQKQVLLSELQHRVKNNLQHVISILEIQKESANFNNIDELIRGNQNRIHSMALLHKKLNVSDNVNEVGLGRYITELSELVKESYDNHKKKISLNIICDIEKTSIEKALPLGLIIVELVSNSMKHAFKKRSIGVIKIEISRQQFTNKLYYADSGKGFDFDKTTNDGLGLEIIKGLIDQLEGTIETKNDNGFELNIYFE